MLPLEQLKKDLSTINRLKNITQALQQDSANYLRKKRDKVLNSREYFREAWRVYGVLRRIVPDRPDLINKKLVIAVTPNQGIYGRLLNRLVDEAKKIYKEKKTDILVTGKKGQVDFSDSGERTSHFFNLDSKVSYEEILPVKKVISKYSEIIIVYAAYIDTNEQNIGVSSFNVNNELQDKYKDELVSVENYIVEPEAQKVVNYFNQALSGVIFYSYFMESMLSFKAAEMILMKNGFDNAEEMEKKLQFKLFRTQREIQDSKLRDLYSGKIKVKGEDEDGYQY
jgi:ATP synthase F1 gamma subunit